MKVNGKNFRTVWMLGNSVFMIDQNQLPFKFRIYEAKSYRDCCLAIKTMIVRGAGAIGAAAGYAMAQAFIESYNNVGTLHATSLLNDIDNARQEIESTRPTARNLFYAVERVYNAAINLGRDKACLVSAHEAQKIADEDALSSLKIGEYGDQLIDNNSNIETHCNAGWLAFVDYGTALSPIYLAHKSGKKVFVYVDETRPRSQGARLTAWELYNENIPHTIIPDNAGAFLMAQGKINMFIAGADRIAANGDTANKIGTYEKAIIAKQFNIPFYIAAPTSTFDLNCHSGADIPIEERSQDEGIYQSGQTDEGDIKRILISNPGSAYYNPAFDVTPAQYITGIITERGIIKSTKEEIAKLIK